MGMRIFLFPYTVKGKIVSASTKQKPAWALKIKATRTRLGMNQGDFAAKLKTTQSNVSKWEAGEYKPSPELFMRMAELAGWDHPDALAFMEWGGVPGSFLKGESEKGLVPSVLIEKALQQKTIKIDLSDRDTPEVRNIPLLKDAAAAGTARAVNEKEIEAIVPFPRIWIGNSGNLYAIKVDGDSMSPILESGYIAIVDVTQRDPKKIINRMVAARERDGVTIKWLRHQDGLYLLVPQHTSQDHPVRVMREEGEWSIAGVVVKWIGQPPPPKKHK